MLATWAAKTALVICSDGPSFPQSAFAAFYRARRPSGSTQVWVGSYALGPLQHWHNRVPVFIGPPEADRNP